MLVSPATNAISERVSQYLKADLTGVWFYVYIKKKVSLADIGNEFVSRSNSRMHIFGQFK